MESIRKNLVMKLKREGYLKSNDVEAAMREVPREEFIPSELRHLAYFDAPLEIGEGQTISAPSMIAIMCEELRLKPGMKVLEIGTGSGYHAALVAKIVEEQGHVYSVERIESLARTAQKNLEKTGIRNVSVVVGDGSLGLPEFAPYERFYVTCAAPEVPPRLIEQLSENGIGLVPVGKFISKLVRVVKRRGKAKTEELGECMFVPLIGKNGFQE
jgi:protein-L-isoaspartate(D-aspartate) O-methyltransferase